MFIDLGLTFDPLTRRCDLTLGEDFDLVLDTSSVPAMLVTAGLDRRADPDDELPEGRTQFLAPASFSERRGGIIDALSPIGRPGGCKMWLLDRAKQTEATRQLAEYWLQEGFAWVEQETGEPATIEVDWVREHTLGYRIQVDDETLSLTKRVAD
ncbi:phage GP46 family protein [Rhizobium sp. SL86]|uniref:phage GP46 family protein n=1 Tax=Rhizobium sp. SL86 TaxID=2995148 RepID=UPI002272418F|nr:phage GP46 family protein [Rhizobium sp. SL86]MCY1666236.1 phage GP46 family protein [Rhizobium sp. SL86]